ANASSVSPASNSPQGLRPPASPIVAASLPTSLAVRPPGPCWNSPGRRNSASMAVVSYASWTAADVAGGRGAQGTVNPRRKHERASHLQDEVLQRVPAVRAEGAAQGPHAGGGGPGDPVADRILAGRLAAQDRGRAGFRGLLRAGTRHEPGERARDRRGLRGAGGGGGRPADAPYPHPRQAGRRTGQGQGDGEGAAGVTLPTTAWRRRGPYAVRPRRQHGMRCSDGLSTRGQVLAQVAGER